MSRGTEQSLGVVLAVRDELSGPIQKAKRDVGQLGAAFQTVQQRAQAALRPIKEGTSSAANEANRLASGFAAAERSQVAFARRLTRFTGQLVALHLTARQIGEQFERGGFNVGLRTASQALTTFAGLLGALPGKFGFVVAATGGFAASLVTVRQEIEQLDERTKRLAASLTKTLKAVTDAAAQKDFERAKGEVEGKLPEEVSIAQEIEANETRLLETFKLQRAAQQELSRIEEDRQNRGTLYEEKRLKLTEEAARLEGIIAELSKIAGPADATAGARVQLAKVNEEIRKIDEGLKKEGERVTVLQGQLDKFAETARETKQALEDLNRQAGEVQKLKEFTEQMATLEEASRIAGEELRLGLTDPITEAATQLDIVERRMRAVIEMGDDLIPPEVMEKFKTDRAAAQAKLKRLKDEKKAQEEKEERERKAKEEAEREAEELRQRFYSIFEDIGVGFQTVFEDALLEGRDFISGLKGILKDAGRAIVRMLTDVVQSGLVKSIKSIFAKEELPGTDRKAPGTPGETPGGSSSVSLTNWGLPPEASRMLNVGAGVGMAGGAYVLQRGLSRGSPGMSAAGGALAGAALGAAFGPLGIVAGALIGGVGGWMAGDEAKDSQRKEEDRVRAQMIAAEEARRQMIEKARPLVLQHIRSSFGGGLASEPLMADISGVLAGGLSAEEIEAFNPEQVLARRAEIENQDRQFNGGGYVINATIRDGYDVSRLAHDLSYHLKSELDALTS